MDVMSAAHEAEQKKAREDWYFTFGAGRPFGYCYVCVRNATYKEANDVMNVTFGRQWSMQYSKRNFDGQIDSYSLKELATLTKNKFGTWRPITMNGHPAI